MLPNILQGIFPQSDDDEKKKRQVAEEPVVIPDDPAPVVPNERFKQFSPQHGGPAAPSPAANIVPQASGLSLKAIPMSEQNGAVTAGTPYEVNGQAPDMLTGGTSADVPPFSAPVIPGMDPNYQIQPAVPRDPPDVQINPFSQIVPGATTAHPEDERDPRIRQQRLQAEGASKNGFWKRAGLGALQGFAHGGLGGAIFGAALNGAVPSFDQKAKTNRYLGQANRQIMQQDSDAKSQADTSRVQAETYGVGLTNQGKVIKNAQDMTELQFSQLTKDPNWAIIEKTKQITPAQAEYFNSKLGTHISAASWQEFVEKVDPGTGKSMIRPTTDPRYSANPTISPDATVPPINTSVGGQILPLKPAQVGNLVISENQQNAQRAQGTNQFNANNSLEAAKTNAAAGTNYNNQILQMQTNIIKDLGGTTNNLGEAESYHNKMGNIALEMQTASDTLSKTSPSDEKAYAAAQKHYQDLQSDFGIAEQKLYEAVGKARGGTQVVEQMKALKDQIKKPPPVNYSPIAPVQTNTIQPPPGAVKGTRNNKVGTKSSYEEQLKRIRGY